jgi:hypothetical protein
MSEGNKGKVISEEHKRKISEARKGKPSYNKGIPCPEERRIRISETLKRKKQLALQQKECLTPFVEGV